MSPYRSTEGKPITTPSHKPSRTPALQASAALSLLLTLAANARAADVIVTGVLTGINTIPANVILDPGATISPGPGSSAINNGIGTLTMNSLTFNAGSFANFDLSPASNDLINLTVGGLIFNTTASASVGVSLFAAGTANPYASTGNFTLFNITGASIGNLANFNIANPAPGLLYSWTTSGTSVVLSIASAPTIINGVWNVNAGGGWGDAGVWSSGTPASPGDSATFGTIITAPVTINLNGNRTVGSLIFNNSADSYALAQGTSGSLTLDNATSSAAITITGNHTISAPVILTSHGLTTSIDVASTLTISGPISGSGGLTQNGPGKLILSGDAAYFGPTIANAGTLYVDAAGILANSTQLTAAIGATISLSGGATLAPNTQLAVNGAAIFRPNASLTGRTTSLGSLALAGVPGAWTGRLDLTNNNLIIPSTGGGANVADQIKQAAAGGAWTGVAGITSSSALAAASTSTATALAYATGAEFTTATGNTFFDGHTFNPTDSLIMYTLAGDANMDGSVTFADFLALQNDYNKPGDWSQGDWNYDGQVTFADFLILQNNYNKVLSAASVSPASSQLPITNYQLPTAAPEPSTLLLLALTAPLLLRLRRRS